MRNKKTGRGLCGRSGDRSPDRFGEVFPDLKVAIAQVPTREYAAEAQPLHEELQRIQQGRRRGPQPLGDILPIVLARLGVGAVQSTESGE